ncbi:MAG: hypothetical protein ACI9G6_003413, partial [Limisphaerales bacterium]
MLESIGWLTALALSSEFCTCGSAQRYAKRHKPPLPILPSSHGVVRGWELRNEQGG